MVVSHPFRCSGRDAKPDYDVDGQPAPDGVVFTNSLGRIVGTVEVTGRIHCLITAIIGSQLSWLVCLKVHLGE